MYQTTVKNIDGCFCTCMSIIVFDIFVCRHTTSISFVRLFDSKTNYATYFNYIYTYN